MSARQRLPWMGAQADAPDVHAPESTPMGMLESHRRDFMKLLGMGGLLIAASTLGVRRLEATGSLFAPNAEPWEPHAYVRLGDDGIITIMCHRSEMGQGIRTTMPMIIADEMEADWATCRVQQAPGDDKKYGNQNTDGSLNPDGTPSITVADGLPAASYSKDANGDGLIFIEAQASIGGKKARIQLEAKRNSLDTKIPRGIAVATDGNIDGNNQKPSIGADPSQGGYMAPDQTTLQLLVGGTIYSKAPDSAVIPPANQHSGLGSGVVDGVLSPEIVQGLIAAAQTQGTWYSDIASEWALGAKKLSTFTDANLVGAPVVIETTSDYKMSGNGVFNGDGVGTNPPPGILLVIGPHTMYPDDPAKTGLSVGIDMSGNGSYYGVVYTDGSITGVGTINIVGMALAKGGVDLKGERRVDYNDNVIMNINKPILLSAQIVPNTWRQIKPL